MATEWSDDTQMAICIARVAATGADLTGTAALDAVATAFEEWYAGRPADVAVASRGARLTPDALSRGGLARFADGEPRPVTGTADRAPLEALQPSAWP